jgi:hypothetical protein
MPNFPPEQISSRELDALVAFIMTLEPFESTEFMGVIQQPELGEEVIMRHWQALVALEVEEIDVARIHIEHVMTIVRSTHLDRMEEALAALDEGDVHEAEHILESMLTDVEGFDGTAATLHLMLMLSAIRAEDRDEASHQLEHYSNSEASEEGLTTVLEELLTSETYDVAEAMIVAVLDDIDAAAEATAESDDYSHADDHSHEPEETAEEDNSGG